MTWIASLFIGLLSAIAGLLVAGLVASLCVDWYRISSFEGGSGYFVIFTALFGGIAGGALGVVVARVIAGSPTPGFLKALGLALGIILVIGGGVAAVARLLADIPPEIDGDTLFVEAELKWPAADTTSPGSYPGQGFVRFGTGTMGHVIRKSETGPLFVDQARREDGRWIVRGAAPIFTTRGDRILDIGFGDKVLGGFIIPLPARPGRKDLEWSEWMPRARPGAPPLPDQFTVRYRALRRSEPIRIDQVGPFTIKTAAAYFFNSGSHTSQAAKSTFTIFHGTTPVAADLEIDAVSVLAGPTPALLAGTGQQCRLIKEVGGHAVVEELSWCGNSDGGHLLTADQAVFAATHDASPLPGWIDHTVYATPGLYQLGNGVLDTRTLEHAETTYSDDPHPINGLPPATVSPDGLSYVWFTYLDGDENNAVLGVTDWKANQHYSLPIDRSRMRYNDYHKIGPAWVDHHFTWVRGPNGHDRLAERKSFTPFPYRGDLTVGKPGESQEYTLRPCGEPMRKALVDLLVTTMGATRLPPEPNNDFYVVLGLDGKKLKLAVVNGGVSWVSVGMDQGDGDPAVMTRVAERIDQTLASGKLDHLFGTAK